MFDFNLNEIIDLLKEANDSGIRVSYENDNLLVDTDEDKEIDERFLGRLRDNKQHLIEYFRKHRSGEREKHFSGSIQLARRDAEGRIPLSFSQERLWFIDQLEGSVQYHIPAALRLKGVLDKDALAYALRGVVNRHEVLRTVIELEEGHAWQRVLDKDLWELTITDTPQYYADADGLNVYLDELVLQPFNLFTDHMLRAHLLRLSDDEHVLLLIMHHIASDGWSSAVLVNELNELYTAATEKREPALEQPDIQFADYAVWQRQYLTGELMDKKLAYWKKQLDNIPLLQLPIDFERPVVKSTRGAMVPFHVSKELTEKLQRLSQEYGATLYMTLLAAFKVLLFRYTGQTDVSVGGVVAGRMRTELEKLIGFFVNTLVLRTDLNGNPPFTSLLQQVKNTMLDAYEHQDVPFERVVEAIMGERDISKNPLFQVIFVLQNVPATKELRMGKVVMNDETIHRTTSLFDLSWSMEEGPEGIDVEVEFYIDIFREATIQRMVQHFLQLLESIADNASRTIGELELLDTPEIQQLSDFSGAAVSYPGDEGIINVFEARVAATPDAPAVSFGKERITYRELNERANQVANYLLEQGVQPGQRVGLLSRRGIDMIVGIWGIIKSGSAYVPFHTGYPAERMNMMIQDAGVIHVLYTSRELFISSGLDAYTPGIDIAYTKNSNIASPGVKINSDDCVNVMFTSGTTGRPKGIAITSRNIINLSFDPGAIAVYPEDKLLQCSNYAFDGSTFDIHSALLKGACLCMVDDDAAIDVFELSRIIAAEKITIALFPTALLHNFIDNQLTGLKPMRKVLFGGEKASLPHLEKALAVLGKGKLVNMYGPTEITVAATYFEVDDVAGRVSVPIGKPVANARIRILDENRHLVPVGVGGELYIGGDGVSLGYVNNEELTAEKYLTFGDAEGRWYRTGDKARWLSDGNVEYMGRIDDQVKVRGYRIEPAEIERTLNNLGDVAASCVVVKPHYNGERKLAGYYVPAQDAVHKKELELAQQQIASWRALYDTAYSKTDEIEDLDEEFNITGWNDSFTAGASAIPAENMQKWVNDITNLIISLKPKRVLEIGSGTGLIYYPISSHIDRYIGTDFSRVSVEQILRRIRKGERSYPDTEMKLCAAHEIILDEKEEIDLVILNSIVQYFPGNDYMTDVMAKAISLLKGEGRIVVGDVRDLRLLPSFKRRLQLDKLQDKTGLREFEWSVDQEVAREEELCFSPAYFYHLQTKFPEITHIEILWKQGDYINELTLYRFTAVMYIGIEKPVLQPDWQRWEDIADKQSIIDQINNRMEVIALQDVPSHRLWKERLLEHALRNRVVHNVKDLSEYILTPDEVTFVVNEILEEAASAGYSCRFLLDEDPMKINLLLELHPFEGFVEQAYSNSISFTDVVKTNIPLFADICESLQKNIKHQLQGLLPDYMVPSDLVPLQYLPLTGNGKVDRRFLTEWEDIQRKRLINYIAPATFTEQQLASIWEHLLGIEKIGIEDNFFEMGGHSLLATRVVSAVRKTLDVELTVKDFFIYPTIAQLAGYLDLQTKGSALPPVEAGQRPADIPLSFSQERLWFIDRLQGTEAYHIPAILRLHGRLDITGLEQALRTIVNRHEVLRTVIGEKDGIPYQRMLPKGQWKMIRLQATEWQQEDEAALRRFAADLVSGPFDLSNDHTLRAHLVKVAPEEHMLVLTIHHIASDGWSMSILVSELVELYRANAEKREPILEQLEVQYADYAVWQRTHLDGAVLGSKMDYWEKQLVNATPLDLPADFPRPPVQQFNGAISWFNIDKELHDQLQELSRQQGVTLFMTLLAAFKVLLYRYSGQEDICIGSPVSGRTQQEAEGLIGFFLNTIALRSNLGNNPSFISFLQQVKDITLGAYEHQDVPFEKIVERLVKDRDMSRSPLFQAMFILQNTPPVPELLLGGLHLVYQDIPHTTTLFDLTVSLEENASGITGHVEYCTDLFTEERMKQLTSHFEQLLRAIVKDPAAQIGTLNLLTPAEEKRLLFISRNSLAGYPKEKTINDLVAAGSALSPEATAVVCEGESLTYRQLDERSSQLAHYLVSKGVRAEMLVPVCLERSVDMVVGILGILKAGGVYVPIDPDYPADRISYMLEDTGATQVLSHSNCLERLCATTTIEIIVLDEQRETIGAYPVEAPQITIRPEQCAYIIYTSGSTGKPKGVMIEHRNVVRLFETDRPLYDFSADDVWSLFHSFCFDVSVWEMYGALFYGAKLVIVPKRVAQDAGAFGKLIAENKVTVLCQTPSAFYVLQDYIVTEAPPLDVRYVIFAGEALNPAKVRPWMKLYSRSRMINMYGITETTVHSTFHELDINKLTSSSVVGKAIPTLSLYVLDAARQLVPVGVPGEIHVGGAGVARGYLNRPELTTERFINDPFSSDPEERLYKSGDLARWLPDGNLEYLGRIDDQVKIRGFRIELGEISGVIIASGKVRSAAVLAKDGVDGNKVLVAYVVPEGPFSREEIIAYATGKLPDYMVPQILIPMDSLPLTSNGKLDRRALPDSGITTSAKAYIAPRNPAEQSLAALWQDLLQVQRVGVDDNFFELGGHSLLTMRMVSTIRRKTGVSLSVKAIFVHPTVAQLAKLIGEEENRTALPVISPAARTSRIPLSFSQERLWFIDQLEGSVQYHVPLVVRLHGAPDTVSLAAAFRTIVNRHEVLRTVIKEENGRAYQHILDKDLWTLNITDDSLYKNDAAALARFIKTVTDKPFDLSTDHMLRADLIVQDAGEYILVITTHHIASDAWSGGILMKELAALYQEATAGVAAELPQLPVQYADYAVWQRTYITGEKLDSQMAYWKDNLEGVMPLDLPTDFVRPAIRSVKGSVTTFSLQPELVEQLRRFSQEEGVTLYMTMLAAFNVLLYRYSGQEDICVGTPVAGRTQHEVENLIGFFINTLALRSNVTRGVEFRTLLRQVQQTVVNAFEHQDVPFEKIVDQVVKDRDMSYSSIFQVIFGLQNATGQPDLDLGGIPLSEEALELTTAKFDLVFTMDDTEEGLSGTVVYCTDLFTEVTVQRMIRHFEQLLASAVAQPSENIDLLRLITIEEEQLLLTTVGELLPSEDASFVALFEAQAARTPEAPALVFEGRTLSYKELNERSGKLAHYLRGKRVKAGSMVPVCLHRSQEMMVAVLGVLKAGAAYVPVEPDFPEERIRYILEDTAASVIITDNDIASQLPADQTDLVLMDDDWNDVDVNSSEDTASLVHSDQVAYVIYTSGSTGQPKGVMVTHSNLSDYITGLTATLPVSKCRSFALMSSFATDLGNTVIYGALATGGALHILSKDAVQDADRVADYFDRYKIDCIKIVPSHWKALCLPDRLLLPERLLIFGGELLETAVVNNIRDNGNECTIVNHYGPTETTIGKLLHIIDDETGYGNSIPVGRPFSQTNVYVLSNAMQLNPAGVPGTLYIGGAGVAKGYLNNEELTAGKFIQDRFSENPSARLYNTGDMVKYLPDGNIVFLGRTDDQVKIRGYRIELGEIERALNSYETIDQAVVVVRTDDNGNKRLIAYVTAAEEIDREEVLESLTEKLPQYMVPSLLMVLDYFPLLPNGKVNRKALPDPESATTDEGSYVAPRNEIERTLAGIWEEVLGVERVGIHDNFFALGGDSIITIQVVSRVRRNGYELQVGDLFDYQTIALLYSVMSARKEAATVSADQGSLTGEAGLLPVQQWYLEKETSSRPSHFNQSITLAIDKSVHESTLSAAIMHLVNQHDSLRFRYAHTEEGWKQIYGDYQYEGKLAVVNLQLEPLQELDNLIASYSEIYQRMIDVTQGVTISAVLLQTPAEEKHNRLLLAVHHLAVDGVSWRILLEDLELLLNSLSSNTPVALGKKTSSYREWQESLVKYGQRERLLKQLDYWTGITRQYAPLPADHKYDQALHINDMSTLRVNLSSALTQQLLQEVLAAYHTDINDVLLAALAKALAPLTGGETIIGLEGHGREDIDRSVDVSHTIGWFTSLYPVLLSTTGVTGEGNLLREIKEQLRQVPDKGIGFGVLKYINKAKALQGNDPWDLTFNYLGQFDTVAGKGKWFTIADGNGKDIGEDYTIRRRIAINSMVTGGELQLEWSYSHRHFNEATIAQLADNYISGLEAIIKHAVAQAAVQLISTPADYGLAGLVSNVELDSFLDAAMPDGSQRRDAITSMYRLSGLQEGMLFHGLYDSATDAYTEQFTYLLYDLDVKYFTESWRYIFQRHAILRSGFHHDAFRVPVQCVYKDITMPVTELDYRGMSDAEQEAAWTAYEAALLEKGFDFSHPPLMHITLFRLTDNSHRMVWTYHHLLVDGWSMPVLMEELLRAYEQLVTGQQPVMTEEDRYEDYIRYIDRLDKEDAAAYWRSYLEGLETGTLLPFIGNATERNNGRRGVYKTTAITFNAAATRTVSTYAQQQRLTMNTLMQAVWAYILHRYTGNRHVVFGSIVSGRPDDLPGVERRVGMYINTLPSHITVDNDMPVADWLRDIQAAQVQSRRHQFTPLSETRRWSGVQGELFDTLMVYENYPIDEEALSFPWKLQIEQLHVEEHTNYPLSVLIGVTDEINILFQHNTALLEDNYIAQLRGHFSRVLEYIVSNPMAKVGEIALLTDEERERLTEGFNNIQAGYDAHGKTILDLFNANVNAYPDQQALVFEDQQLTYRELDRYANRMAHFLRSRGVKEEVLVAVCMERSLEMVVGVLAILKAGGACLPLDPAYPAARIRYMLDDSRAALILTGSALAQQLDIPAHTQTVIAEAGQDIFRDQPEHTPDNPPAPHHLCYVIYTSGSTGNPKGVMIEHKGVVNLALSQGEALHLKPGLRSVQFATFGFDASCYEIFNTLSSGGCLIIPKREDLLAADSFSAMIQKHQAEMVLLPPSYQHTVREDLGTLRTIVSAGEALIREDARYFQSKGIRVVNAYGPTENTVCATITDDPLQGDTIVIGKPLPNVRIYILDAQQELCPVGVAGEICMGGAGVSRGYLNKPELTAEKFIPDTFSHVPGARLYRSGDLGRWLPDGNIEYLGRIDDQVKIRGYRIEPGEIETVMMQSNQLKQAVVAVKTDNSNRRRLVAFVVPQEHFDKIKLQAYLEERLPAYMLPSSVTELDTIPLTANGKVDKQALLRTVSTATSRHTTLNGNVEETLAVIWKELLGVKQVDRDDNFFELGGDSIITIQVVGRAKRFGYELKPKDLFVYQTIAGLSQLLASRKDKAVLGEQGILSGNSGLLPIQQWYLEGEQEITPYFNQQQLLGIDKKVTAEVLFGTLQQLMERHDALRFTYTREGGEWLQQYGSPSVQFEVVDLRNETAWAEKLAVHGEASQHKIQVHEGRLISALLFLTPDDVRANRLLITIHHLAVDGVSWRILQDDLERLFDGLQPGSKSSSYREWYNALAEYGESERLLGQRSYWRNITQQYVPLQTDHASAKPLRTKDLGVQEVRLDARLTRQLLQTAPQAYRTEINDILLAALAKTLRTKYGRDTVIGLEGHGREDISNQIDISNTVGWFTSLYPVLLSTGDIEDTGKLLKEVKEQLRQMPDKGLGYGVLKYINKEEAFQGNDPWDITFNYLGQVDAAMGHSKWFSAASETSDTGEDADYSIRYKVAVNSSVRNGELVLYWTYSTQHFEAATIEQLSAHYLETLQDLITHTVTQAAIRQEFTPSDFNLGGVISNTELDNFLDTPQESGKALREQVTAVYRLSSLQEGMLFHGLYESGTGVYMQQLNCTVDEPDIPALIASWQHLLQRHSVLRSGFFANAFSVPVQAVFREVTIPVAHEDYRHLAPDAQQETWINYELSELTKGFNFKEPPLTRVALLRLTDTRYRMIWTFHHLLLDGWSGPVLVEELLQAYDELSAGKTLTVVEEDRYEDYIRYLDRRDKAEEVAYWKQYLSGIDGGTLLPFVGATAERTKGKGIYRTSIVSFDELATKRISAFAQQQRVTVNTVVQGVWAYLLSRYTGSQQVTYGVTVSGRPDDLPGIERKVGMFINTLPLYTGINDAGSVTEWLHALQHQQVQSREYQYTALNDIQSWLEVPGDLFDNFLVFENYPVGELLETSEWRLQMDNMEGRDRANYPLGITAVLREDIEIKFKYNAALLQDEFIQMIGAHFRQVLQYIVHHPDAKIGDIIMTDKEEQLRVTVGFNDTPAPYDATGKSIIDLFREQVAARPDATALMFDNTTLTYQELDTRSNQLAHYLRSKGVQAETLVPLCLDRSLDMIVAILGIIKAGGAYLPIDPSYPQARITYMLEDSRAAMIVTSRSLALELDLPHGLIVIRLDAEQAEVGRQPVIAPESAPAPHHLAYVIYTSGSTGNPKGVMLEHKGVVNLALSQAVALRLTPGLKTLQFAAFGFDASCYEIFNTLLSGGCLVLPRKEDLLEAARFGAMVSKQGVELVTLPPSYQHTIREELGGIRTIVSAGEPLNREDARYFQSKGIRVINAYGPTENTVCTTLTDDPIHGDTIVIGKPVINMKVYILDEQQRLCATGVAGEICSGGPGIARGYLYRPELTAEKFIADTFSRQPVSRLYRTGDLGRWLPDGSIEYLGRIDDQVKVRGYRIELGEIESVLEQYDDISKAVVVAKGTADNKVLVAYIIAGGEFDRNAVIAWLENRLPEYMVPSLFVKIDSIPVTANGKVDRKALPDPDAVALAGNEYVAPRNETEEVLAEIWGQLLEVDQVGVYDDFFALGGHSLLSIRLIAAVRKKTGVEMSLSEVFETPTIAAMTEYISRLQSAAGEEAAAMPDTSRYNEHIRLLNQGNAAFPMFLIPGQDGLSDGYDELAKELNDTGAVYGLQMQGVLEGERPLYTIEEIAAQNISRIREIQPDGPYRLIAHSFGGYVLYEMVKQLEAAGQTVTFAAILDAEARPGHIDILNNGNLTHADIFYQSAVEALEENKIIRKPYPDWIAELKNGTRNLSMSEAVPVISGFLQGRMPDDRKAWIDFIMRLTDIKVSNIEVLNNYKTAGKIKAPLNVIIAAEEKWEDKERSLGWGQHCTSVNVVTVPGNHFTMLKGDNATVLSVYLKDHLATTI
ncbi:MAG TPA: non-ribosomal peptide synthase/polyketide synthase [Chitinophaga sp.]|uniref:non-ribosomal peptide synthase/polyketide synthase n=1 Tax=Chitinophaga sp. TaxID=1869181 RepID=UPI002C5DD785|nr:non-ribosomal peptide synthase/polyketide synthase [Chitinophaga sp.]HVI46038.1 non-ribosomal peptide synthase/polyketide synthase [Chitinophaga sp.]